MELHDDLIHVQHSSSDFRLLRPMCRWRTPMGSAVGGVLSLSSTSLAWSGTQINVGSAGHMLRPKSGQQGSGPSGQSTLLSSRTRSGLHHADWGFWPSIRFLGKGEKAGSRVWSHFSYSSLFPRFLPRWCASGTVEHKIWLGTLKNGQDGKVTGAYAFIVAESLISDGE